MVVYACVRICGSLVYISIDQADVMLTEVYLTFSLSGRIKGRHCIYLVERNVTLYHGNTNYSTVFKWILVFPLHSPGLSEIVVTYDCSYNFYFPHKDFLEEQCLKGMALWGWNSFSWA